MGAAIRHDNDRPAVQHQEETGEWWIRASAIGGCVRALAAAGRGLEGQPTPEFMQKAYDAGHANEPVIRKMAHERHGTYGKDADSDKAGSQHAVDLTFRDDDAVIHVTGHLDDYAWNSVSREGIPAWIYEYKAMGPSYVDKVRALGDNPTVDAVLGVLPASYKWGISVYMWGSAETYGHVVPARLFIGCKDAEGVVRDMLPTVDILNPPLSREFIGLRAWSIINAARDENPDLPACDVQQYPCPFYLLHDDDEVEVLEGTDAAQLATVLTTRTHHQERGKFHDAQVKLMNGRIAELLADRKSVRVQEPGQRDLTLVTWVRQEVKEATRVVKAHVREYPKVTRPKADETSDEKADDQ